MPHPLSGHEDGRLHMKFEYGMLKWRFMAILHQKSDEFPVCLFPLGSPPKRNARGLYHRSIPAHKIDEAQKTLIEKFKFHAHVSITSMGSPGNEGNFEYEMEGASMYEASFWVCWGNEAEKI